MTTSVATKACVNPDHLEPVTSFINVVRGRTAELCAADAFAIRLAVASTTLFQTEIAAIFAVDPCTVCDILQGRSWVLTDHKAKVVRP